MVNLEPNKEYKPFFDKIKNKFEKIKISFHLGKGYSKEIKNVIQLKKK